MRRAVLAFVLLHLLHPLHSQAAEFVYRGQLEDGDRPAEGRYAMQLRLHAVAEGDRLVSVRQLDEVSVAGGKFAVPVEFHDLPGGLDQAWLEVAVKGSEDPAWSVLPGRSKVALGSQVCPASWELAGNVLTSPDSNFLGTLDATALELRVADERALRINPVDVLFNGHQYTTANLIGGAAGNSIDADSAGSTIVGGGGMSSGGFLNPNRIRGINSFIGSGSGNQLAPPSGPFPALPPIFNAAIVGGLDNVAFASGAFVGGGFFGSASGLTSAVLGGFENSAQGSRSSVTGGEQNTASGSHSVVSGGQLNIASGRFSMAAGGFSNVAGGDYSAALGRRAIVRDRIAAAEDVACSTTDTCGDEGTFIWADSQNFNLLSSGPNQFLARASGGFWFGTNSSPSFVAGRLINTSTGAHLTTGGSWTNASSRDLKEAFVAVDTAAVLDALTRLSISRWRYRDSPHEGEHLGPVAEEFAERFGLGSGTASISTVDASGVALAAIQGLNAKLEAENAALRERLDRLDTLLQELLGRDQTLSRPDTIRP